MFDHGVLNIFPSRGLDQSILVAVLIGIFVLLFLTEMFGWVWAGLVVPGYLASVFVIQASSGIAICIEAAITFVICRLLSDVCSQTGGWSPFFGRERFFLIVLVSVFVRQACELYLLSHVMQWIEPLTGMSPAEHQFSSIGLVLVPLLANMAWKLSLPRAAFQIGVTVAITWAVVALVILRYTNLSYSNLELTYENVALDFLGSPKAYIILLSSTFIAARLNLSYGWDYNGILVPSLLALTWFEPRLAITTVVEATILVALTKAALATPMLRRRNLEGPRKLALVFSLGFALKLVVGWVIDIWSPLMRLTDLLGFGYVLTSLIAVKMINLNKTGRVLLPSVAVSLVGFVAGNAIGYGLEQLAPRVAPMSEPPSRIATSTRLVRSSDGVALLASVRARIEERQTKPRISPAMLVEYRELWSSFDRWLSDGGVANPVLIGNAQRLGLRLVHVPDHPRPCWALIEGEEALARHKGWDVAVLCPGARGPVLEVLRPRGERPAAQAAARMCERIQCVAIVFSGVDLSREARVPTSFAIAHHALAHRPIIELRVAPDATLGHPTLHVRHALPSEVHLPELWQGQVALSWEKPPDASPLWDAATPRVVLRLHPDDAWESLARTAPGLTEEPGISVFGWVDRWNIVSAPPPPPSQTELLVLEELVVTPMIERRGDELLVVAEAARALGHELRWLPDGGGTGRGVWMLAGRDDPGWIALAIAAEPERPLILEAPRPRVESGSGRLAAATFQSSRASALLLDPEWVDRTAGMEVDYGNTIAPGEVATAFHAAHQALARHLVNVPDGAIVELRGYAVWRPLSDNVIVSVGSPLLDRRHIPPTLEALFAADGLLGAIGGTPRWVDGAEAVVPLLGVGTPQLLYAQAIGVPFASVWVSPAIRRRSLPQDSLDDLRDRATRMGAQLIERPLIAALAHGVSPGPVDDALRSQLESISAVAFDYAHTGDLATLALLLSKRGATAYLGWSPELRAGYVLIEMRKGPAVVRAAAVLGTSPGPACASITPGPDAGVEVWRALQRWCLRFEIAGKVAP